MKHSDKAELRRALSAKRRALTHAEQKLAARAIDREVAGTRMFRTSRRIACYLPNDGEVDPSLVIERIWRTHKTAFLPVLSRLSHEGLWFAEATPGIKLRTNRFGIPEPCIRSAALVRADTLDLILLPLLGFDTRGNRLGRGAGFYDRSLAFLQRRAHWRKPRLLGLAHEFQRVPELPADPWDIPLDGVVTDQATYYINF